MSWKREGYCNKCGECCRTPLMNSSFMLNEHGVCKFLIKISDTEYECKFKIGEANNASEIERKYYIEECLPFPNPDDIAHLPPNYNLPQKCGYKMVRDNGK